MIDMLSLHEAKMKIMIARKELERNVMSINTFLII